jgi:predicted peroxiredoxin
VSAAPAYLLVETRSALLDDDSRALLDTAAGLAARGHEVHLFLLQDGVLAARANGAALAGATAAGVRVRVDDHSLAVRGGGRPAVGEPATMADLVALLVRPDCTAVWH